MKAAFTLADANDLHECAPSMFWLPPLKARQSLQAGDLAKLVFQGEPMTERMWVRVTGRDIGGNYRGTVNAWPIALKSIKGGDMVTFTAGNVIDIDRRTAA